MIRFSLGFQPMYMGTKSFGEDKCYGTRTFEISAQSRDQVFDGVEQDDILHFSPQGQEAFFDYLENRGKARFYGRAVFSHQWFLWDNSFSREELHHRAMHVGILEAVFQVAEDGSVDMAGIFEPSLTFERGSKREVGSDISHVEYGILMAELIGRL